MQSFKVPENLIFKLLYRYNHLTNKWSSDNLALMISSGYHITYMPYFMNIGYEGISNLDLVKKIKVTKQGVSKIVRELEKLKLVYTTKSESDARSIMIFLTKDGEVLFEEIKTMSNELTERYVKHLGEKKYNNFIETFVKIIQLHEELETKQIKIPLNSV
ncbi:DNA-binding MarR family transcriptional regulator [Pedobacter sp. CG_S7]|uniref:MarR family winged helix-turn-helix transcriptional regulator n=1 Tax=Pedobacter sp. CG_S7 TaxID=3143930 RepID=UPI00339684B0